MSLLGNIIKGLLGIIGALTQQQTNGLVLPKILHQAFHLSTFYRLEQIHLLPLKTCKLEN
jgi:hypothetical protein